jgi:flagellin
MPLVINTNTAASIAASTLNVSNSQLEKSLARLSSGSRITAPSDDAGGLAVAMKINSATKRTSAVLNNIGNALSYLQTQDGALQTVAKILDRMSELKVMHGDPTKSVSDRGNYSTEFKALQMQLNNLTAEKFNGVDLFVAAAQTLDIAITEAGDKSVSITQAGLSGEDGLKVANQDANNLADPNNAIDSAGITIENIRTAIQSVATMRAQNGAEASQLLFASDVLIVNRTNLEAARSRIMDTDIAAESSDLAKNTILVQAGIAMLGQANTLPQAALKLLS